MNYPKSQFKYFFSVLLFVFLSNCQLPDERAIDTREVAQQVKDQKPKRVTETDLQKWLQNKSNVWFAKIQRRLLKQIPANISDSLLKKVSLNPELDSLQNIYKFEMFFLLKTDLENPQMQVTLDKKPFYQDAKKVLKNYPKNTEEVPNQVKIENALETENFYKEENKNQENKKTYIIHFPLRVQEEMRGIWVIIYERQQAIRFFDYKEL